MLDTTNDAYKTQIHNCLHGTMGTGECKRSGDPATALPTPVRGGAPVMWSACAQRDGHGDARQQLVCRPGKAAATFAINWPLTSAW